MFIGEEESASLLVVRFEMCGGVRCSREALASDECGTVDHHVSLKFDGEGLYRKGDLSLRWHLLFRDDCDLELCEVF